MGLYGENKDYEELVKENIEKAKLLYNLSDKDRKKVIELLNEKEEIKKRNGFLANIQLQQIQKRIKKIKSKY